MDELTALQLDLIELADEAGRLRRENEELRCESRRRQLLARMFPMPQRIPTPEDMERLQDMLAEEGLA